MRFNRCGDFSFSNLLQEQGWDQEEGLRKVLNPLKHKEARGCWLQIRECILILIGDIVWYTTLEFALVLVIEISLTFIFLVSIIHPNSI